MRKRLVIFGAVVLLAGCSSPPPPPAPATSAPRKAVAEGPQERTYLRLLRAIDPGLVQNPAQAIVRGHTVCADLAHDWATAVTTAASRFGSGPASLDQAKAEKIVVAIESSKLCGA